MPNDVSVGLVSFADRAHLLVAPTRDRAAVQAQLLALRAGGSTALYDAVGLAISQVGPTGERLVCVLSDGADNASRASLAELTSSLRRARVATEIVSYQTDAGQTRTLSHLAAQVGGRLIPATDARSLVGAFSAAAGTFGTQIHVTATLGSPLAAGDHTVAVAVTVAGHRVTDSTTVAVAAALPTPSPAAPAPAPSAPVGISMTGPSLWALLVLVFVALVALFASVLAPRGGRARASLHALDAYRLDASGQPPAATAGADSSEQPKGVAQTALSVSERYVQRRGTGERLALRLEQADLRIRPNEFVLLEFCVGVALVGAVTLLTDRLLVGIPVGFLLTVLAAHVLLSHRAKRRASAFEDQLPDTLHLVSSSIRTRILARPGAGRRQRGRVEPDGGRAEPGDRGDPPGWGPGGLAGPRRRPDGQQRPAVDGDGGPDPAAGGRQPLRGAGDHRRHHP